MSPRRGRPRLLFCLGLAGLLLFAAATARGEGLDVQNFKPALSRSGFFTLESPRVLGHLVPNVGLTLDYGKEILVARDPVTDEVLPDGKLVDNRFAAHLTTALGLWNRAEVGLRVPVVLYQSGSLAGLGSADSLSQTVLGDLGLGAKVRLLGPDGWGAGLRLVGSLAASLPTGSDTAFAGSGAVAVRPGLVAGLDLGPLAAALNLGYVVRGKSQVAGLTVDDEIDVGLAAAFAVAPDALWGLAEVWGRKGVQGDTNLSATPIELDAGLRFVIWGPWLGQAGLGAGLSQGYGAPKLRGVLALAYAPVGIGGAPASAPTPAPSSDADGDGILDGIDRCPGEAEDRDGFEDGDGCPEYDNDGDGVPDGRDGCSNDPEDKDGFQDADGCPELDNDGDGVVDAQDACPDRMEDTDGFQDGDGCPENDNDGDGIPDIRDKCPNEAEVWNGNADDDGCPDAGAVLVELTKEKLVIRQEVKFQTGRARVKPDSFQLLATVAKLLVLHPEITRVRVEGHTDAKGKRDKNLKLSQARAEAVRNHLIEVNGIEAERLQAVGYGPDRPVASNKTKQGRALNRRVEFIIVAQ
ncbi:MAG: OmpA family protein [Deltaproteobacteria bacterium]|nr:OmpA family protein [Deltaproteobacteria bacterium]